MVVLTATPYTRPLRERKSRRPWTPEGQLLLDEALDLFGKGHFGERWTGEEMAARTDAYAPPQPPSKPKSDHALKTRHTDGTVERVERPVYYVIDGVRELVPFEEALELFENEKDELFSLWQEETAAYQRLREALGNFRQVLHAGHIKATVQTEYGSIEPVPRRIWASKEAFSVFNKGRASFSAGDTYWPTAVEGIVLIPKADLKAYFRSTTNESQEQAAPDPAPTLVEQVTKPAGESRATVGPTPGGRPTKWDWEACLVEICRIVYVDGVPETQAEMVRRLQEWFIGQVGDAPAESEIKKRVSKVFCAIREAENSEDD